MDFDFAIALTYWPLFLKGLGVTLLTSVAGAMLGIVVGACLTLVHSMTAAWVRWLAATYVSFFRGTPLIVQVFLAYYALPSMLHISVPAYVAGVAALGMNSGAFVSEILRGGLATIPRGQFEAARALGMSGFTMWRFVVFPQVMRVCLPPLTNELTILIKATPVLSVITLIDLTRAAQLVMNQSFLPIESFVTAAVLYFCVLFGLSLMSHALEMRGRSQVR